MDPQAEEIAAPSPSGDGQQKRRLTFLDLPAETKKEIFTHVSSSDLIALSLVSKHFRDLAAAQLYRNFHIVFPDEDDPSYESPIDGLAGGLDTFVTSEYNYAQYLKEIVLDTLSGAEKSERAYRHYKLDVSGGKFMNTLFLLTLRKAKALETFKCDLRIELTRPVFKALHQLPALQNLHLRMQTGRSLYEIPPPLPSLEDSTLEESTISIGSSPVIVGPFLPPPPGISSFTMYATAKHVSKHKSKTKDKDKQTKEEELVVPNEPPTLSGFKNLKSLAVVDIDNLSYVDELKVCIRNSSPTLHKLKISICEHLARLARKPPPVEDPEESDAELDEFGNLIPPPPPPGQASSILDDSLGSGKSLRAQECKKEQDAILGRLFGIEPTAKKDGAIVENSDDEEKTEEEEKDAGKAFIKDLTALSKRWMKATSGSGPRTAMQKESLAVIEKAAKKYVAAIKDLEKAEKAKKSEDKKVGEDTASEGSSTAKSTPNSSEASVVGKAEEDTSGESKVEVKEEKSSGMFDTEEKARPKHTAHVQGPNPDDIDVEEPEVQADPKDFEDVAVDEVQSQEKLPETEQATLETNREVSQVINNDSLEPASTTLAQSSARLASLRETMHGLLEQGRAIAAKYATHDFDAEPALAEELRDLKNNYTKDFAVCEKAIQDEAALNQQLVAERQVALKEAVSDYVRSSRGLQLKSLAIYLIPIKASVLSKAVDLSILTRITLLNVGPQAPFWNQMSKLNAETPVSLRKIHSDNITVPFLTFVGELESLSELFMIERTTKLTEYSFAPKTVVTIEQMRKMALKKHIGTLKRLMIKNENDTTWDANEQTLKLICKRGKILEELAISFGVRAVHTFNQYLPGLTALRAMHIIQFRNDDTCHWVIREIRKFVVDSVSHNPEMQLEYIALEGIVERLVRRAKKPKKTKGDPKGKGKETESPVNNTGFLSFSAMLGKKVDDDTDSESESEDEEDDDMGAGLKLETLEGVRFYDIYGVRIFKKEIMSSRL